MGTNEAESAPRRVAVGPNADADAEDEALAAAARARYLTDGIESIEPDNAMRSALRGGEQLLALREMASIDAPPHGGPSPLSGRLALTNERLVIVDGLAITVATLEELDDVTLIADRLQVMLASGTGFTIEAQSPRLLRVQLAEARANRSERQGGESEADEEAPGDLTRR